MFSATTNFVAVTRLQLPRHPVNFLDRVARTSRLVVAGDRFNRRCRSAFRRRSRCRMVRSHRVVERIGCRASSTACTAATNWRSRLSGRGCGMISTAACTSARSGLRHAAGSAASAGSRRDAAATTPSTAGRGHGHRRSTASTATASASHRHHAHRWLLNPLPIITGVNHGIVVAVHRGLGRQFIFAFGPLVAVMTPAVASSFMLTATVRLASAVAATELVREFVQTRTISTAGVAACLAT